MFSSTFSRHLALQSLACIACVLVACGEGPTPAPSAPSRANFEMTAYPVLLRDCAFPACHASSERFFQVFGPGRVRLDPLLDNFDPATPAEVQYSYERARSMLVSMPDAAQSLLVRKPLEASAGGIFHKGADAYGRNVYASTTDPGYQALLSWAMGQSNVGALGTGGAGARP